LKILKYNRVPTHNSIKGMLSQSIDAFFAILLLFFATTITGSITKYGASHDHRLDFQSMGRADHSHRHDATIVIKQQNMDMLLNILYDVSNTSSPNYGKYLSFDEVGALVRNDAATEAVKLWLQEKGISILKISPYGDYISCSADVKAWEAALETEFFSYHNLKVDDIHPHKVLNRAKSYKIPDAIEDHIHSILGIASLPPRINRSPMYVMGDEEVEDVSADFELTAAPKGFVSPTMLRSIYGIFGQGNGLGGQGIYTTNGETYMPSDLVLFHSEYALIHTPVTSVVGPLPDSSLCVTNPGACAEPSIDLEYLTSVGQNIPTTLFYDDFPDGTFISLLENLHADPNAHKVYSISYSATEWDLDHDSIIIFNNLAITLGARGITIVAAAGDDGVNGFIPPAAADQCGYYAQWPASSPYVTAVGGTMNGPLLTSTPEIACSSSTGSRITSGGGFSFYNAMPSFQTTAVQNYLSLFQPVQSTVLPMTSTNRAYPDISMAANRYSKPLKQTICLLNLILTIFVVNL
jgi:tripeptidyl-peptidase I